MELFKIVYFVWLFTVCNSIELSRSDKKINDFIEWAKQMDRGPYSGPFRLEQVTFGTLDEYEEQFHKELCCNYVVSAIVHMYIIETIIVNSYYKIEPYDNNDQIDFTKQAAQMLYVVFNINTDDRRHTAVDVLWLFTMYTDLVDALFWERFLRKLTEEKVLETHKVVVKILEEYVKSHSCDVFDPTTNNKVTDVIEVVKTVISKATNLESLTKLVGHNKAQLNRQNEHNYKLDDRFNYGIDLWYNVGLYQLLFEAWTENEPCYVNNLHSFGIQMDLKPIKYQLKNHCRLAINLNNLLVVRIEEIIAYQKKFLHLMKVIAIRIFVRYLQNINRMSDTVFQDFVLEHAEYCNGKMIDNFNRFANHFDITDDQYIRSVIDMLMNSTQTFVERSVIDGYVNILLELLENMSSEDMRFDTPTVISEESSIDDILFVVNQHAFILSATPIETIDSLVRESLIAAEVFVTYATRYTYFTDFKLMKSFRQLGTSETYRRLRELENIDEDDLIEVEALELF